MTRLSLFRPLWGFADSSPTAVARGIPEAIELVASNGRYAGIEFPPAFFEVPDDLPERLAERDLDWIALILTDGPTVAEHVESFRDALEAVLPLRPRLVNCHSGRDAFDASEAETFFREVLAIERDLDIPVAHETHRGRILFNPWVTRRLVDTFDDLHLTADLSHWVCVSERLLDADDVAIVAEIAPRVRHTHARVGFEEGPQVPDPRTDTYRIHLDAHMAWWRAIWDIQTKAGADEVTADPEYGPPPYLHTDPGTSAPLADLDEICDWMSDRLLAEFEQRP